MNNKNFLKFANISGWLLMIMLILYFISGYAIMQKYGMDYIISNSQALFWHKYLTIPFIILLFLHIVPWYIARKQIKRFFIILSLIFILPVISVYAIDKLQNPEIKQPVKKEQTQNKSVQCNNCPKECVLKPGETGKCGKFKNVDGELVPVEKTK